MKYFKSLIGAVAVLLIAVVYLLGQNKPAPIAVGSVPIGNEYHSTTTRTVNLGNVQQNLSVLQIGPGALGSVIITGAAAGTITLYDATSTVNNASWATTTIATLPNSTAAGTYTFDSVFYKGLLLEYSGTLGTSTITWRGN